MHGARPDSTSSAERAPDYSQALDEEPDADADGWEIVDASGGRGERLDRFLARTLVDVSRSRIQRWIGLGAVRCEERALSADSRLAGFERLLVRRLPREADAAFAPDPVPIDVVHEDAALIVVDKQAGLVVHPASGNWRNTLLNGLLYRWPGQSTLPRAGIVHRLDKDTSGLMVVGRTEQACTVLASQLANRSMSRQYLALVAGQAPDAGEVDAPIGRDPQLRTRMAVVAAGGRTAYTSFRCLARGIAGRQRVALLHCKLRTGRTHQIRVHLKSIGLPLLGDAVYGGPPILIVRQALHAWSLALTHPDTGLRAGWVRGAPADFRLACEAAGIDLARACEGAQGDLEELTP